MAAVLEQEELVSIERAIPMRRVWAMPSPQTFDVLPIRALVKGYLYKSRVSVDPFARNKRWATYTNDLNPDTAAGSHLEAAEFLQGLLTQQVRADLVLFDPPYSLEQCKRSYENVGRAVTMRDTQIWGRWTEHKELIRDLTLPGAIVISCGWNTAGIGMKYGFSIIEILIVCHSSGHNDTIITVERKVESTQGGLFSTQAENDCQIATVESHGAVGFG